MPSLLNESEWGLTSSTVGAIGASALLGMAAGAFAVGAFKRVGRRPLMIGLLTWTSLGMGMCAVSVNAQMFASARLLTGVALGALIPLAIAMTAEFSRPDRRNLSNAIALSGYAAGGVLSAVVALAILESYGFRMMFAVGTTPLILVLPVMIWILPEAPSYLVSRGKNLQAAKIAQLYGVDLDPITSDEQAGNSQNGSGQAILTRRPWVIALSLFSAAYFCGQVLNYGMSTWLPKIMNDAGYSLDSALLFLLSLNCGAIAGTLLFSRIADRIGSQRIPVYSWLSAAACLLWLGIAPPPNLVAYFLVCIIGFGSIGSLILLSGQIAHYFPPSSRSIALGVSFGASRIGGFAAILGGGILLDLHLSTSGMLWIWIIPTTMSIAALLMVPKKPGSTEFKVR
ncbi:MFS transporter [Rhodococcus sp. ABRD24]|uniref:MFS transporter n=1 Tax=Rhodococcus sp. ABRD24 TaxID=2507582 RepID=UPI001F61B702|nr:MFS transporter [Rhodococcus sp. ABRD24]